MTRCDWNQQYIFQCSNLIFTTWTTTITDFKGWFHGGCFKVTRRNRLFLRRWRIFPKRRRVFIRRSNTVPRKIFVFLRKMCVFPRKMSYFQGMDVRIFNGRFHISTEDVRIFTEKRHISTENLDFYGEVTCFWGEGWHLKVTGATASVAQSVERLSRDPGSRLRFPAAGIGVAFFTTCPGWVVKCISFWHLNLPYFKKSTCWKRVEMQNIITKQSVA